MNWHLHFLGVGGGHTVKSGSPAAVLECDGQPFLLIDCGPDILDRYQSAYHSLPRALYITHTHMDHVGAMEALFSRLWFDEARHCTTRLFCHAALVPWLQTRLADYPGVVAEGGVNYWDAFQLVPCSRGFWLDRWWFDVFASRHHRPQTSFGLALAGSFAFTGDTRPIPEVLRHVAGNGELIAHDCSLHGNPSHSGIDDIEREYDVSIRKRLLLYHYCHGEDDGTRLTARGYRVAKAGLRITLPPPLSVRMDAG